MKRNFWMKSIPLAMLIGGLVISATAWQTAPGKPGSGNTDTIPERNKKVKDIDEAIESLEKGRIEMEQSLKNFDARKLQLEIQESMKDFDATKIKAQIEKAMQQVDAAQIQMQVDMAMKNIDIVKMQKDMQESMKTVDSEKLKAEIEQAMKAIDVVKIKADVEASVSKIDFEKMKADMERVKEIDFKKMEEELKNIQPQIEKSMTEAREGIEKAKVELTAFKGFIEGLQKDGLISNKDAYTIEYKNGDLTINGKKQSAEMVRKYNNFLKDRKDFTIKKEAGDFNIDID